RDMTSDQKDKLSKSLSEMLSDRQPAPRKSGLSPMAKHHCANFWTLCKNCRLFAHRMIRCGYFESCVLPGLKTYEAKKYCAEHDIELLSTTRDYHIKMVPQDCLPEDLAYHPNVPKCLCHV